MTPELSTAVWVGNPNGSISMDGVPEFASDGVPKVQGGTYPAKIWKIFTDAVLETQPVQIGLRRRHRHASRPACIFQGSSVWPKWSAVRFQAAPQRPRQLLLPSAPPMAPWCRPQHRQCCGRFRAIPRFPRRISIRWRRCRPSTPRAWWCMTVNVEFPEQRSRAAR